MGEILESGWMKAFLDTHAAVLLYEGERKAFGRAAADLAENAALFLAPMVELELEFLSEIGRLTVAPDEIVRGLSQDWGVVVANDPMRAIVTKARACTWTHDPFDRLIVATAQLHRAPLIARDRLIHEHFEDAVW